jgi:serine/threonine-protein kinase
MRQLNPEISARTERAVAYAMNLHPDERPQNIEAFKEILLGSRPLPTTIGRRTVATRPMTVWQTFRSPMERTLLWLVAILALFSLVVTLWR